MHFEYVSLTTGKGDAKHYTFIMLKDICKFYSANCAYVRLNTKFTAVDSTDSSEDGAPRFTDSIHSSHQAEAEYLDGVIFI